MEDQGPVKILAVVPVDYLYEYVLQKSSLGREREKIIGSLASHFGILDDEFEGLLAEEDLSKIRSWYNNLEMHM